MGKGFPESIAKLVDEFSKMPGIGPRSAQRMAFHVLQSTPSDVEQLIQRIHSVKKNIGFCSECGNFSDKGICDICSNTKRDQTKICVVEDPSGVIAMEKSGVHNGLYHVLLGELSPIDGVGPEELNIEGLVARVKKQNIEEIILATDFTTEGETTALYIMGLLRKSSVKITRLARGVPVGGCLEYADVATLQRAFEERRNA